MPIELKRWQRIAPVPRYLLPLARRVDSLLKLVDKGVLIDSPTVIGERQPNGQIIPRLRPGVIGGGAAAPRLAQVRPTTLNGVIAAGTLLGLWPSLGVAIPTTINEVITAGTTLGLWPTGTILTPTTLNEVIAAGTTLGLWR